MSANGIYLVLGLSTVNKTRVTEFLHFCCVSTFPGTQEEVLTFAGCAETEW